jgi:D-alanyl-D-alanine carboxypeptidase/D-alanyl-D-alanine-endopeptidase (penicillin-binding protein 4)
MKQPGLRATVWLAALAAACPCILAQSGPATTSNPAPDSATRAPEVALTATYGEASSLASQIAAILAAPNVARDHWGIQVTALDGTPIYSLNEAQLFQPASNAKLFTTTAALALLGPNQRSHTTITGALDQSTGTVQGNLTLIGGGDANFDSQDLPYIAPADRPKNIEHQPNPMRDIETLVAQLKAKGVKQITGDIVGDDTMFLWQRYPEAWSIDDMVWGYGAPVSALTISDNELRLTVAPGAAVGQPASVNLEQAVDYYSIQNDTRTVSAKSQATGIQIAREPGSRMIRLFGFIARGDALDVEHVAIDDPAEYAAMTLRAMLIAQGIKVNGTAYARHRAPVHSSDFLTALRTPGMEEELVRGVPVFNNCYLDSVPPTPPPTLANFDSAPLKDDLLFTNKVSQNLHAEIFLRELGDKPSLCGDGSILGGTRMVRAFLVNAGIDANEFIFYDGSGLSGHDLVTPRATAKLLAYAAHDPKTGAPQSWFAVWKSSLPVGGEDGTLASRFGKTPLKDHVFAKTGTLGEARALSGYLDAASGRTVIFSIFVGNHLPGASDDRDAMDKIVAAIQAAE